MSEDGDRRRYARETLLSSAVIRQGKQIHSGTIHNICENGMFVALEAALPLGAGVQVRFKHPWTDEPVTARAVIMRRNPRGGSEGPAPGVGVQFLTTLSDLEDEAEVSTSATIPPDLVADAEKLRKRAMLSRPPAPRDPTPAAPRSAGPPKSKQRRRGRKVTYNGVEAGTAEGLLRRIADDTVVVAGRRIPNVGRLIRVTIDGPTPEAPTIGLAGKVIWNSSEFEREGGLDQFEVSILHFLSKGDEERYRALIRQAKRARAARRG